MTSDSVTLIVAGVGFAGAVGASLLTRLHEQRQQTRNLLAIRAESFARAAHAALAELRGITPPRSDGGTPHRNDLLRTDVAVRQERFEHAWDAIDLVRGERASLPLFFGARSEITEQGRLILEGLRASLESAERFYEPPSEGVARESFETATRRQYKNAREGVYNRLTDFYDGVSRRI